MTDDDDFTPHLGRIGDLGRRAIPRASRLIRRAAAKVLKPKRARTFTGERIGVGAAAARMTTWRRPRLAQFRMRRVVVKVFIARAKKGAGTRAFGAHLNYIERDGVDRDGASGRLYNRASDEADGEAFHHRSLDDKRQFRLIISPEDGAALDDLKENARALMRQVERDLGRRLDWVAVDHFNTGLPHTHIVIRGRDARGEDLIIARDYLMEGLRARASELMTERLGPRRDLEILKSRSSEVTKDRFTGIDRDLAARAQDGLVRLPDEAGVRARFDRMLALRRLRHLEGLALASHEADGDWRLAPDWERALTALGRRDDIVKTLAAEFGEKSRPRSFEIFDPANGGAIIGRIAAFGRKDELRDERFLLLDGVDGKTWYADIGETPENLLPGKGAVIELSPQRTGPRRSDETIARIARANGGRYSEPLHRADDPYSTGEFRETHKRRLEALRRADVVERLSDGSWRIGADFIGRAAEFDRKRAGLMNIRALSWRALDDLIEARAVTWLDDVEPGALRSAGFGALAESARSRRLNWLRAEGLLAKGEAILSSDARARLDENEVAALAGAEARNSGRRFQRLTAGRSFDGAFEKTIDGASRRFAIIGRGDAFTLVDWRNGFEAERGRRMTVSANPRGVSYRLGVELDI